VAQPIVDLLQIVDVEHRYTAVGVSFNAVLATSQQR
jgi:hypothetical protein